MINDEIGNIDKATDQLQGGMDIEGWAALPWKHEVPDASFVGNLNEDGSAGHSVVTYGLRAGAGVPGGRESPMIPESG